MFWSGDTTTGKLRLIQMDDSTGNLTIKFESDSIEDLEYAKFGFESVWEIPYIIDDEALRWHIIKPDNWLEAFPTADQILVTLPDSSHELDYTQARAIGLKIFVGNDLFERVIIFGDDVVEARKEARWWAHGILTAPIKQIDTLLEFENPDDGNGFGEGLAIAAVTISRAMYPTDSDLEAHKGPPEWLLPPKF